MIINYKLYGPIMIPIQQNYQTKNYGKLYYKDDKNCIVLFRNCPEFVVCKLKKIGSSKRLQ